MSAVKETDGVERLGRAEVREVLRMSRKDPPEESRHSRLCWEVRTSGREKAKA